MCIVCNIPSQGERCKTCHEIYVFCKELNAFDREGYVLVVDGSFDVDGGAGLVLAREEDEVVIAYCTVGFTCTSSNHAEFEAIKRGLLWAPLDVCWSDSKEMIKFANRLGLPARHIPQRLRDPLHNFAHRLANIGRTRDWDKLSRVWVPGEVWP